MAVALHIHSPGDGAGEPEFRDPLAALAGVAESGGDGIAGDYCLLHSGTAAGFSVLGWNPLLRLLIDAQGRPQVFQPRAARLSETALPAHPLSALEAVISQIHFAPPHPLVGWLGFISYDIGRHLERIPRIAQDDLRWPLICFTLFERYCVFDRAAARTTEYQVSLERQPAAADSMPREKVAAELPFAPGTLVEAQAAERFCAAAERVREYIAAGDIYQANLSQRWVLDMPQAREAPPHALFARLCALSPAAYAACLRISDDSAPGGVRHILSASPELFLTAENGRAITRPIKGTRPRDLADAARDKALGEELLASEKDRAELAMIVDLLRNDLGRVSRFGSVRVVEPRVMEGHPTVWHTAATIASELRAEAGLAEVLGALCPGGSITGAPKIRAMQIIEELEPTRRGLYCGNIGVISSPVEDGACPNLALSIAIRTIQMNGNRAYVHAGAGIVADSDPALEYRETLAKAWALLAALGARTPQAEA